MSTELLSGTNLTPGLCYRTTLENPYNRQPCVDVQALADCLPHGGGIDGNWTIEVLRDGAVRCHGEYHAMDENGYYCGWRNFRFTLRPAKKNVFYTLTGPCEGEFQVTVLFTHSRLPRSPITLAFEPCEGKFQVTKVKGKVYLESFTGGGDARDYLYDDISYALSKEMDIHVIESVVVASVTAAQHYSY